MISEGWRAAIGSVGASAICWGAAGAVHMVPEQHSRGTRGGVGWSLPEGGGWYEFAAFAGLIVTLYSVPGLLRRAAWWPSLSLSFGTGIGIVTVLALGQGTRYWVAAAIMAAVGIAPPVVNRRWGRHHPV
ncbi:MULTISPECIES: hypothetical protein [unclassified Streptomyces]|uniref:hypothetical protein n=1 Tax=unclassified Streptomyces TaxID=2593676 RepID=UPI002966EC31|nr:hypothetical protein [Streptomyces sp. SJL17-1]